MGRAMHSGKDVTDEELSIRVSLPKLDGNLTAPAYWPKQRWAERDRAFSDWCARNPRHTWPDYVESWFDEREAARRQAKGGNVADDGALARLDPGAVEGVRRGDALGPGGCDGGVIA